MANKYHRQGFSAAGFVTKTLSKAATKAAEKIKKINKKDIMNFSGNFKKKMKALKSLNKPAVDEYNKTVKEIFSRKNMWRRHVLPDLAHTAPSFIAIASLQMGLMRPCPIAGKGKIISISTRFNSARL